MDPRIIKLLNTETNKCLPWPGPKYKSGYGSTSFTEDGVNQQWRAHRLICFLAHGPPPTPKHVAAHKCHNKPCCNKRHVRWRTQKQNMAESRGRPKKKREGYHAPNAILTENQVRRIRRSKKSPAFFAKRYNVSAVRIRSIRRGKGWPHIS